MVKKKCSSLRDNEENKSMTVEMSIRQLDICTQLA